MGLLDWFRRRRRLPTRFWVDEPHRIAGLVAEVRQRVERGQHVVVVAHFPAGLVELGEHLAAAGIDFETLSRWTGGDDRRLGDDRAPRVVAILARGLPEANDLAVPATGDVRLAVLAGELHVLAEANERVRRFAAERPVRGEARAHASFDSPHVRRMVGASARGMLQRMGMRPDEPIDSPMVTRGIERALAKLERQVTGDRPADSLAEWLHENVGAAGG